MTLLVLSHFGNNLIKVTFLYNLILDTFNFNLIICHFSKLSHFPKMDDSTIAKCNEVMDKIRTHPISELFLEPVDPERDGAPDYFKQIKKPMDLGTVQNKLNSKVYKNVQEWKEDMNLICTNATQYNGKKSYIGIAATEISKIFRDLSRTIADGSIMTWYSTLIEIKRDYKNHALAWVSKEHGESDVSFANPKLQTKDVDTQPEVHRFLIKSMPLEELDRLRSAMLKETRPEARESIKKVISNFCPEMIESGTVDMNLLPPAALTQLKEICMM